MIARYILPFFGGTPAVWSSVQLFFQVFLTGGYAYAAWLVGRIPVRKQARIHIPVLLVSLVIMFLLGWIWPSPITPGASWKPDGSNAPIFDIFRLLLVAVGLPYFLLSTNSSLTQAWFNRAQPGRSPYWLYAFSNIGSLLGLLAYPFLIEPSLTLSMQGWAWSGGFVLFTALAITAALRANRVTPATISPLKQDQAGEMVIPPSRHLQLLWILLSALGSTLLLAITSQITQEVATTPFLWVLPLSIYLLTFILTYSNERWYNRRVFGGLLVLASLGFAWALVDTHAYFISLICVYCFILFVSVMICNGETYRLRPAPAFLTRFYLMTSIGGAVGGIAINLFAPYVFKGYWELPISFGMVWAVVLAVFISRNAAHRGQRIRFMFNVLAGSALLFVGALSIYGLFGGKTSSGDVDEERNFYGVVRVMEVFPDDPAWHGFEMVHGITIHGLQMTLPAKHQLPTTYYTETGGMGLAILNHPRYGHNLRVGVIGLGIGTLAAYGQPGDVYRFYEINPIVVDLAQGKGGYFSYLKDSRASISTILGDGRISLERELELNGSDSFDVLVLDAFSSDSVPVHLLTKEAFDIYLKHLAPGGTLAVNISNRNLDLKPVLWQQAKFYNLAMVVVQGEGDGKRVFTSQTALLSRSPDAFQNPAIASRAVNMDTYHTTIPQWTDDFSNLFQILQ